MKLYRVWRGMDSQGSNLGFAYTFDYQQAIDAYRQGLVVYEAECRTIDQKEYDWTTITIPIAEDS